MGITLEKIEDLTKVHKRYLRAIESGAWDKLPEPVYTRGFIHSYARVLGMDLKELQMEFDGVADNLEVSSQPSQSNTVITPLRKEKFKSLVKRMKYLFEMGDTNG